MSGRAEKLKPLVAEDDGLSEVDQPMPRSGGIGAGRPSRHRTTVGHDQPCDMCSSVEWEIDDTRGEIHCGMCGLVVEERVIDHRPEWIHHGDDNDRSRVGAPTTLTLSDKGLNTHIDRSDLRGARARAHGIHGVAQRDWSRRAVIDQRTKTRSSRSRNLVKALQFIRDRGGLPPQLVEESANLYRRAAEKGVVTGRSIAGVSAATTYLAAREAGLPRRIEDIAESFQVDMKELKRTIRLVSRVLGTHKVTPPDEYLDVFSNKLGLPPMVLGVATELWESVRLSDEWQGKKPAGVAGVMLYRAAADAGHSRTQAEVCEVAGVSEVTLRGLLRILDKVTELLEQRQDQPRE